MSLNQYIERNNNWNTIINKPTINARNLTHVDARGLLDRIECELSPENLSCDGELSRAEVNERYQFLNAAKRDLLKKFPQLQYTYA